MMPIVPFDSAYDIAHSGGAFQLALLMGWGTVVGGVALSPEKLAEAFRHLPLNTFGDQFEKKIPYRYSDLGFYLLAELVERLRGVTLDKFVKSEFFDKLGLISTLYRPLTIYDKNEIVPSEQDDYFRFQKIQGTVHDMGAAIIGGVSGHAGLFSKAYEVAVIGQMLLQNGNYGGIQLLKPETVALFTHMHPDDTRRAIGFDMSQQDGSKKFNMSRNASAETFGHTGFTGTCIWIDPKYQLVYVFFSNRTYPSMENNLMNNKDYRESLGKQSLGTTWISNH